MTTPPDADTDICAECHELHPCLCDSEYAPTAVTATDKALAVIGDKKARQREVANVYAECIEADFLRGEPVDWTAINTAILGRWKMSGLYRIKDWAWKSASADVPR